MSCNHLNGLRIETDELDVTAFGSISKTYLAVLRAAECHLCAYRTTVPLEIERLRQQAAEYDSIMDAALRDA